VGDVSVANLTSIHLIRESSTFIEPVHLRAVISIVYQTADHKFFGSRAHLRSEENLVGAVFLNFAGFDSIV
jgi:hypothetical protein